MTDDQLVSKNKRLTFYFYVLCAIAFSLVLFIFINKGKMEQKVQIRICGKESKYEEKSNFKINEKMIEHQLFHYIELLRGLTNKKELFLNWQIAQGKMSTGKALKQNYVNYKSWGIGEKLKENIVSYLQFEGIEKETKTTYRVHWNESLWSRDYYIGKKSYYGFFVLELKENQNESQFIKNPTGIYIKEYSIAEKEF